MNGQQPLVVHITSNEISDWQMAMRNLVNLVTDESVSVPPEQIQVVVNGHAVRFLLSTSPEAGQLAQMTDAGVDILACENSLDRFGYGPAGLAEGIQSIPSGVAEVVRAQQHGDTYLKLP